MTPMTAIQAMREVERVGGRLRIAASGNLGVELPDAETPRLVPILRALKPDLLMLLRAGADTSEPCMACGGRYWWRAREGDPWKCGHCEEDPRVGPWRGVTAGDLGARLIVLDPPAGDLPARREWVRTPMGMAEVMAFTPAGDEIFVRLFKPPRGWRPFTWFSGERVIGESEAARERWA